MFLRMFFLLTGLSFVISAPVQMNAREKTRILSMRDLRDNPTPETELLNSTSEENSLRNLSTDFETKSLSSRNTGLSNSVKIQDEFIARLTEDSGTQLLEQEHEVSKFKRRLEEYLTQYPEDEREQQRSRLILLLYTLRLNLTRELINRRTAERDRRARLL
ncbi:uncharacterized protein LOC111706226 [Eurytemora carolleeae]|uniref:uncharacterized protein LOC111706226 n=1 Tax=Eurytemora carolleeae TaxID=1294199 RepID=UPI000C79458F|nr:uncharacterized protein LOC111706226 [Eurytemora carolleeae]|eukprot:XP_023334849.1 uncharacterized protein LOC111706226 [Eurytemora affinis]